MKSTILNFAVPAFIIALVAIMLYQFIFLSHGYIAHVALNN